MYHGTTSIITTIDVNEGKPYKDFGRGFYVTQDYAHAHKIASRNKRLDYERGNKNCAAYVYTYELDMRRIHDFKVLEFADADMAWMRFVLANRSVRDRSHAYDIIIGPTANDDTSLILKSYYSGLYGDIDSEKALQLALDLIESNNLPAQICFSANAATLCLTQKGTARKL